MSGIPAGAGSLLGKRLGKYEILALLALGGTAEIYLARIGGAAGFEKYVVVKCLHDHLADDQEFVKMFLDEARLAAHLDHSNIVQTMELGEQDDRYYMVMEFLAGLSLAMVVRRAGERLPGGLIPAPLVLNMMAQACAGLHYAHERAINGKFLNIVHRDISPQNLVISFEGVVKVVDFGIAKAEQRETKTRSGTIKGKFAYMSPEQCVANDVDRRTDVFALGVIAHELLTGRRLFKRNSPYETYQAVIECAVAPPSKMNVQLDPALDALIMKAVAKDKDARYPTAEAFGDALLSYLHHRGKGSGPGDVSRFFDASFAQEIEEHGARMRELISGRDAVPDAPTGWDDEAEEKKRNETVDLGGKGDDKSLSLDTADLLAADRPSSGSLSDVIGELGSNTGDDDDDAGDDSDMPVDKTRIESNPLELLAEMNAAPAPAPAPAKPAIPSITGRPPGGSAPAIPKAQHLPAPPNVAAPASTPKPRQVMPPSGPLPLPAPPTGPAQAGGRPSADRFPNLSNLPTQIADTESPSPALARTEIAQAVDPQQLGLSSRPDLPIGYPVMNAHSSQQMMSGNVYPSEPYAGGRPSGHPASPPGPPPSGPPASSHPPPGPQLGDSGPRPGPDSGQHVGYPGPAASLMSPVGQQYPQQVDWAQAAAAPARALPSWMLAVLFIGAIGVALTITIIIARIIR